MADEVQTELDELVAAMRRVRKQEVRAKLMGILVGVGLSAASLGVLLMVGWSSPRSTLRFALMFLGSMSVGAIVYRFLMPKKDESDIAEEA